MKYKVVLYLKSGTIVSVEKVNMDDVVKFDKWYSSFHLFNKTFSFPAYKKDNSFDHRVTVSKENINLYDVIAMEE